MCAPPKSRPRCGEISATYNEIVHFQRNIFNLPSGGAGKHFIEKLTFWLKQFNSNSDLNSVALKAIMVLPSVILQKPSATSKTKEHSVEIEQRLALWRQGDLNMLMKEIRFIQDRFVNSKRARSVEDISKTFAKLVFQGTLTAAIKFLDKENSSVLLNLSDKVLAQLKEKHPASAEIEEECLLHGPVDLVPHGIFDLINEQRIFDSALKTKGSAGPSGMDAELYRQILCSKNFVAEGKTLREEIATLTRNLLQFNYHPSLLEGYTACRLIPLDKNPEVRPIGVGVVLRRIIGKTTSAMFKEEIKEAVGPLQVCAGHSAGSEAAIHAMNQVFNEEGADEVLLIDATNAFNQMNRAVAMHNIMALCIINTYRSPSRLFISGGGEIFSQESTTQGDLLAMPWYAINTNRMISSLRASIPQVKQVWLVDDSAGGGSIESLYQWYKSLCEEGKNFGYIVNGAKSCLIVKNSELAESAKKLFGDEVNITLEGRRHLGVVIGSKEFKNQYCQEKVDKWLREMESLTEISKSQPHAAYVAFTKGFKSKFTYYLRTIESFEEYVDPIEEVIHTSFLPSLFGRAEPLPEELKELVNLSPAQGGIGIRDLKHESSEQFNTLLDITAPHVNSIVTQSSTISARELMEERKREISAQRRAAAKPWIDRIDESLFPDLLQAVQQTRDKRASSWLNAIPIEEHGLPLNKQEFRDSLCLRYNLPLRNLPN